MKRKIEIEIELRIECVAACFEQLAAAGWPPRPCSLTAYQKKTADFDPPSLDSASHRQLLAAA